MRVPTAKRARIAAILLWLLGDWVCPSLAQDDAEPPDPDGLRPGLIAGFRPSREEPGHPHPEGEILRIDRSLVADWGSASPDPRLEPGPISAFWRGWLLIRQGGPYRFRLTTNGDARLRIGDRIVSGEGSDPIDLRPGLVALGLDLEGNADTSRLVVDWEGPGFGIEHIPPHLLVHEVEQSPPLDRFEQGRRLADQLGCANCHAMLGMPVHRDLGPPLDAAKTIRPEWLTDWLRDPSAIRPGSPMPGFGLDSGLAADLAAFLRSVSDAPIEPDREALMAMNVADAGRGRLAFRSAGCLGCHPPPEEPTRQSPGEGPDLSGIGRKRSPEAIAFLLGGARRSDPGRHRPSLGLSTDASAHLATYLGSLADPGAGPRERGTPEGDPNRGWILAASIGCANCHRVPGVEPASAPPLVAGSPPAAGCLADDPPGRVPRFDLDDDQRAALRALIAGLPSGPGRISDWTLAEDALRRRNCLGCHSRYGEGGERLGARLAALLAEDRELNALKGTLTPPDLSSVGAKLRPEYLDQAVRGLSPTARPWLSVRMPRFAFEDGEAEAIVSYLQGFDAIDDAPADPESSPSLGVPVGIRLLGRDGFSCVSCHVMDGKIPPGGEAETLGPDLTLAHRRMSRAYFDRWLADPQRIIPGTPMPQFLLTVPGTEGTLPQQLGSIWDALGDPEIARLSSTAARQFLVRQGDRALVVRDLVVSPDSPAESYPRAVAIGLIGDRSLLFDADRLSWIRWWDRGFLSRTKQGRLWEWHPEGRPLRVADEPLPPVAFRETDGAITLPQEERGRLGSFRELAFEGDGVRLSYRLNGPTGDQIDVTERIVPTEDGWERLVLVTGTPNGVEPVVVEIPPPDPGRGDSMVELLNAAGERIEERTTVGPARANALILGEGSGPPEARSFRIRVRILPGD
ncbi:cytochrome c1 [Tautonia sociabilis]|uniref:Cytochrome c1 n=1 Tax=Tautonia sociabilis TaxID=2080755 RepID=A0A432MQC3_9BACT|nr:cytochrome c1 [Tautonia sociabilis]RUL89560.1 cytochrome c1 [Tautonia sociabilis]